MSAKPVVTILETKKLQFQICPRPEQKIVATLATDRSDQSFNERMRQGNVRNCFDFRHAQYSQISLPLMESIQRIMVRTQVLRNGLPSNGTIEHRQSALPSTTPA